MTTAIALQGRPVWAELLTTDPAAAEKFYAEVIGWTFKPFNDSPQPYDVIVAPILPTASTVMRGGLSAPRHGSCKGPSRLPRTTAGRFCLGGV